MPKYPTLIAGLTSRDVTDTFYGYNHRMKINAGEFFDMKNLSTKDFPMLSTRPKRGIVSEIPGFQGMLAKDKLAYVADGILYYDGAATPVKGLSAGEKQMCSMGAYICIFPDKVFYNTEDPEDYGSMESRYSTSGVTSYELTTLTGENYENYTTSPTAPENPENMQYWFDTSTDSLKQWNANTKEWTSVATVYTRLKFESKGLIPKLFQEFDGVEISGTPFDVINGQKVIYGLGGSATENDWIIVVGLIDANKTTATEVTVRRTVPDMDYVIECQNRIWGCKYGFTEQYGNLNELYCCALGDFKNWRVYQGISTDSWTASVGSDGPWTGAINFLGYPTFFKENRIHRVTVSQIGAHSVTETVCRGVQKGSEKSLIVVNETLLYKSRTDVCIYQGSFPSGISVALGDKKYYNAVAGTYGEKYYISMEDENGNPDLFVYDTTNNLWAKEDNLHAKQFATLGDCLYCFDSDHNVLYELNATEGSIEQDLNWLAQSGIQYYEYPDRKYISRFDIRLAAEAGAEVNIYIQYDSDGIWRPCGHKLFRGLNTITFPVKPRRCDHLELRLEGSGPAKIYSIARILEQGSDV